MQDTADASSQAGQSGLMKLFDFKVSHFIIVVSIGATLMFCLDYMLPWAGARFGVTMIAELTGLATVAIWLALKDRLHLHMPHLWHLHMPHLHMPRFHHRGIGH